MTLLLTHQDLVDSFEGLNALAFTLATSEAQDDKDRARRVGALRDRYAVELEKVVTASAVRDRSDVTTRRKADPRDFVPPEGTDEYGSLQ